MHIQPLQNFVLIQFKPKTTSNIVMPDGQQGQNADVFVLEVGPEVPKESGLEKGVQILLRGDSKIFTVETRNPDLNGGVPAHTACVPFQTIMAIVHPILSAGELDAAIAAVNSEN